MNRNFKKVLSFIITLLMVENAFGIFLFAENNTPYQSEITNLTEENLLLSMDDLTGANLKIKNGSGYTYTAGSFVESEGQSGAAPDISGAAVCVPETETTTEGWQNYSYIGKTNLPLNNGSQYTVIFDFNYSNDARCLSYAFSAPADDAKKSQVVGMNSGSRIFATKGLYTGTGDPETYGVGLADFATRGKDMQMMLSIDKGKLHVYIDSIYKCTFDITSEGVNYYTDSVLALGGRSYYYFKSDRVGNTIFSMSNIKVYDGSYTNNVVTNAKDGDMLLYLDNFDLTDNVTYVSDYDIDVTRSEWSNEEHDGTNSATVSGNVISHTRSKNNWYMVGVDTTLPLDANSKYTIEFYVKELMPHAVGLVWSDPNPTQAKDKQGFIMYDRGGAQKGYDTEIKAFDGGWNDSTLVTEKGGEKNIWPGYNVTTTHKDVTGYVRYTITIDGNTASLYAAGKLLVEDAVFDTTQADHLSLGIHNWTAESRGQYANEDAPSHKSGAECTPGEAVEVKDIRVWQGHTVRKYTVSAMLLDGQVQELTYGSDNLITEFPDAGGEITEDETVIWIYSKNGSNIVAIAPLLVTSDITLIAKKVKISDNTLVGIQYTAPKDNKQNIRFISTIHSLKGSAVGFEVTAKYMKNGVLTEQSWDKSCTYVYTAIKAKSPSGTVKDITANELGGTYLFALSVDAVPTDIGQIDFYVRSYVVIDGKKVYDKDASTTWTLNGGETVMNATLLGNSSS